MNTDEFEKDEKTVSENEENPSEYRRLTQEEVNALIDQAEKDADEIISIILEREKQEKQNN